MPELVLSVPEISCGHCVTAISTSVGGVHGVDHVEVDLATRTVCVRGAADVDQVRAAIIDAGYDVA